MTLAGTAPQINVTTAGSSATISAQLTGKSGMIANGAGTLILTNNANNYTGVTKIANGTVEVGTTATAGSLGAGAVSLHDGGTLDLVSIGTAANNIFAQSVSNGVNGTGTLKINSANTNTLSGALTDGTLGKLAFTQAGTGTTILTNAGNTYTRGHDDQRRHSPRSARPPPRVRSALAAPLASGSGTSLNLVKLGADFLASTMSRIAPAGRPR